MPVEGKIVLVGDSSVGKTVLFSTLLKGVPISSGASVGSTFGAIKLPLPSGEVKDVGLWDTAGSERFLAITRNYYRSANFVIIMYDVTNSSSFKRTKIWYADLKDHVQGHFIPILIGNKVDLTEMKDPYQSQAEAFAKKINGFYLNTSATNMYHIDELKVIIAENYNIVHNPDYVITQHQDFGQQNKCNC